VADKETKIPVILEASAWEKIIAYAKAASPNEVIGMAHAKSENGKVVVYDPFILKQTVSRGECEIDKGELAKFIGEHPEIDKVLCVWHSHVDMSAFFSTCDRGTSETLAALGKLLQGEGAWFVSIVVNVKEDYECKIDMFKPIALTLQGEVLIRRDNEDLRKQVEAEVKEKCSDSRPTWTGYGAGEASHGVYGGSASEQTKNGEHISNGSSGGKRDVVEFKGYTLDELFHLIDSGG
jgi:proteasome lid subunit RPN8/RPN11